MARAARPQRAKRSVARNRGETEDRILQAVGSVLARDGFAGIGINAVAREAAVDKVLIYRYFGSLPELLRVWGGSGRFWPSVDDMLGDDRDAVLALPLAERYARFFEHFIDALRARPLTLEILASELQQRNELTAILEAERERWGEEAAHVLGGEAFATRTWLRAVTLLLIAGVQYLLLRARRIRTFGGVAVDSDAGWETFKRAVRELAHELFDAPAAPAVEPAPTTTRDRRR